MNAKLYIAFLSFLCASNCFGSAPVEPDFAVSEQKHPQLFKWGFRYDKNTIEKFNKSDLTTKAETLVAWSLSDLYYPKSMGFWGHKYFTEQADLAKVISDSGKLPADTNSKLAQAVERFKKNSNVFKR